MRSFFIITYAQCSFQRFVCDPWDESQVRGSELDVGPLRHEKGSHPTPHHQRLLNN